MPIYYKRYRELFGEAPGILNDLPRPYGGSTLRAMQIDNDGAIIPLALHKTIKYMPWWLPASNDRSINTITTIVQVAQRNKKCISANAYQKMLETYERVVQEDASLTFGEAVNITNFILYKNVYPELPTVKLNTIKNNSFYTKLLAAGIRHIASNLLEALTMVANLIPKKEYGCLGILTNYLGTEWKLIFMVDEKKIYIETLNKPHIRSEINLLVLEELCYEGKLLLSSYLLLITELSLTQLGYKITHFGNTYGKLDLLAQALGISNCVEYWDDDEDSWNSIILKGTNGVFYPLHLLDMLEYGSDYFKPINSLINRSMIEKKPIIVKLKKGGDLLDALFN